MSNKFIRAIKDLNIETVASKLKAEPKWLEWQERDGKNALHYVCGVPMFEMRPEGKPIANLKVVSEKSLKILKLLLRSGMDINSVHRIPEKYGFFPAHLFGGRTPAAEMKSSTHTSSNREPIRDIACMPSHGTTTPNPPHSSKSTEAFGQNHLLERVGSLTYFEDIDGPTGMDSPLLAAYAWKKWKMAEWLLENGADPDAADKRGATPLFHAVRRKYNLPHIKLLLKHGADPDGPTNDGRTPR